MMLNETPRPLGIVKEVVAAMRLDISYAYDDLVFVEHNAFMFRFGEKPHDVDLLFNRDCPAEEAQRLAPVIGQLGKARGLQIHQAGWYSLTQNEDDTLSIAFF